MKLRRSARTILATALVMVVFTLMTIWHNKAPGSITDPSTREVFEQLVQIQPDLQHVFNKLDHEARHPGFYLVISGEQSSWPICPARASYADPLAKRGRYSKAKTVIRYRSPVDLILMLDQTEKESPGVLTQLDISRVMVTPEPPLKISLRLIASIILGASGVWLVLWVNRKTKNSRKHSRSKTS